MRVILKLSPKDEEVSSLFDALRNEGRKIGWRKGPEFLGL